MIHSLWKKPKITATTTGSGVFSVDKQGRLILTITFNEPKKRRLWMKAKSKSKRAR